MAVSRSSGVPAATGPLNWAVLVDLGNLLLRGCAVIGTHCGIGRTLKSRTIAERALFTLSRVPASVGDHGRQRAQVVGGQAMSEQGRHVAGKADQLGQIQIP